MSDVRTLDFRTELNGPAEVRKTEHVLIYSTVLRDRFRVLVTKDGAPASLSGQTIAGYVLRPDGATVVSGFTVEKETDGTGYAAIVLPAEAYAVPGNVIISIFASDSSAHILPLLAVRARVAKTTSDTVVDPGDSLPSVAELEALIAEAASTVTSLGPRVEALESTTSTHTTQITTLSGQIGLIDDNLAPTFSTSNAYSAGSYVLKDMVLYRFTVDHEAGAWTGTDAVLVTVGNELDGKANIDGYYESMAVGNAEQLISSTGVTDTAPYNFRTAGGTADIGGRAEETIVGGTICWNQQMPIHNTSRSTTTNGVNFVDNRDGSYSFTTDAGGATADTLITIVSIVDRIIRGHKYYIGGLPKDTSRSTYSINDAFNAVLDYGFGNEATVTSAPTSSSTTVGRLDLRLSVKTGVIVATPVTFKPYIIDLTAMFGSAVADAVYAMEQATAGAGVAWFRSLFPKPYYAYNAGELMSVRVSGKRAVGFNAWDEEWELGRYNNDGSKGTSTTNIRSKNAIKVIPGTSYYVYIPYTSVANGFFACYFYDASGGFVSALTTGASTKSNGQLVTIPEGCYEMRFFVTSTYGTTYKNDICINLSWSGYRDGEYEAYKTRLYPLDSSLTLRGIPKWDSATGAMYYDGDTYESDGTVTRRFASVADMGSLTWYYNTNDTVPFFWAALTTPTRPAASNQRANIICSAYVTNTADAGYAGNADKIACMRATNDWIIVYDSTYTSLADFTAHITGAALLYELATPTTETADPYQSTQWVDDFGTEEFIDAGVAAGTRGVSIPVGHSTLYRANLRRKLEELPADFSSLIAPTEKTNKATRNYANGDLLIMQNVLYKTTAAIATGGSITPGTNCTATTLAALIKALQ